MRGAFRLTFISVVTKIALRLGRARRRIFITEDVVVDGPVTGIVKGGTHVAIVSGTIGQGRVPDEKIGGDTREELSSLAIRSR